jgi:N-acetylglucosamine malate deacetylase 1
MRVLAIGCHPDDLEIGCGGTLAKYEKLGHDVIMCHLANGNLGHAIIQPDELREIRTKEAENAGSLIGVEVINGDIGDYLVYDTKEARDRVVGIICYAKPDIIITHSPNDYMPDHVATSKLVFDAAFGATLPHYEPAKPVHPKVTPIYYMDTLAGINFNPTEYVDVTDTLEVKLEMLKKHESQINWMLHHDHIDFVDFVRTCAKFRGLQCGAQYAEAFTQCYAWPKVVPQRMLP